MKPIITESHVSFQEVFASTLIHSLWQGALIVLLMWLVKTGLAKNTKLNYILSLFALLAMVLVSICTFLFLWNQNTIGYYPHPFITDLLDKPEVLQWFNLIWLIGASLFFLRFLFSHFYLRKLIHRSTPLLDKRWMEIFQKLKNYYCINKSILLLQSDKVTSAFLTGVIKPVIIIPTSWINQLSYKEAECIVAHELSHVFNRDHWVNLFIQFSEIIFYFNPAAHILMSHIKLERELKADSSACYYLGEPLLYAKLILKIEETSGFVPALTLPFFQQRKQLKRRIESVLQVKTSKNEFTSGLALVTLLISVLFFSSVAIKNPSSLQIVSNTNPLSCETNLPFKMDQACVKEMPGICLLERKNPKEIFKLNRLKEIKTMKPLRVKIVKGNESDSNEDYGDLIAYEEHSNSHDLDILAQIERDLKVEKNNKKTIIYEITKTKKDSNESLNGGNWDMPGQVKCYAPVETKTYIIIKSTNNATLESETDWNIPGRVLNQSIERH